jgi:hypothetical protein
MRTNQLSPRQLFALAVSVGLFLVALGLYTTHKNPYAPQQPPSGAPALTITNQLVLQNWLPAKSYDYTVARLNDYAKSQQIDADSITIRSAVTNDQGAYGFTVSFDPAPDKYVVDVLVNNFNSVLSTSVSINGATQQVSVPTNTGSTNYGGFDALLDHGLSSVQAKNLQIAFAKYDSGASTIAVDASTITTTFDNSSSPPAQLMNFTTSIDGKNYSAVVDYTDLSSVRLVLYGQSSHKQLFDSGKINTAD